MIVSILLVTKFDNRKSNIDIHTIVLQMTSLTKRGTTNSTIAKTLEIWMIITTDIEIEIVMNINLNKIKIKCNLRMWGNKIQYFNNNIMLIWKIQVWITNNILTVVIKLAWLKMRLKSLRNTFMWDHNSLKS